jgi:uncharacterized protein (UPF0210 family)
MYQCAELCQVLDVCQSITFEQTYLIRPFTLTLIRFDARLHKSRKKKTKKTRQKLTKRKKKKIQTLDILTTGIFVFSA